MPERNTYQPDSPEEVQIQVKRDLVRLLTDECAADQPVAVVIRGRLFELVSAGRDGDYIVLHVDDQDTELECRLTLSSYGGER